MKTQKELREEAQAKKGNQIFNKTCAEQTQWCRVESFTKNKWAKYDVAYKIKGQRTLGEIKVRTVAYPDYILEIEKLNALREIQRQIKEEKGVDVSISYINIIPNNLTYIWDLTNLDLSKYKVTQRWLQKNDYDETLVLKDVIMLPHVEAFIKCETEEEFSIFKKRKEYNNEEDNLPF